MCLPWHMNNSERAPPAKTVFLASCAAHHWTVDSCTGKCDLALCGYRQMQWISLCFTRNPWRRSSAVLRRFPSRCGLRAISRTFSRTSVSRRPAGLVSPHRPAHPPACPPMTRFVLLDRILHHSAGRRLYQFLTAGPSAPTSGRNRSDHPHRRMDHRAGVPAAGVVAWRPA
jgi:hypothetical protein